jgi:hypothetical protein
MKFRAISFFAAAVLSLTACPTPTPNNDGGKPDFDAGNPPPVEGCSGGCAVNQYCQNDPNKPKFRECIDGCEQGCDGGTCVKIGSNFQCQPVVTTCNGTTCSAGQVACINGGCACLGTTRGATDTCAPGGQHCDGTNCVAPKKYQQCTQTGAACPVGMVCSPVFGDDFAICVKTCGMAGGVCALDEICDTGSNSCLPSGLFSDQYCAKQGVNDAGVLADGGTFDGGTRIITVSVGDTCLTRAANGTFTETTPTGNCTYSLMTFYDLGLYPFDLCRPTPRDGGQVEGGPCKNEFTSLTLATQCGTGLECALTRGGDNGVCLRMCNANPPHTGYVPQPACGTGESCVNLYRLSDPNDNAVLGVCMKACNVFDPARATCAPIGGTPASCVPTAADGRSVVTPTGEGVCVPQRQTIAALGQPCPEVDAFKGAVCDSAQVCASNGTSDPVCTRVCDTECGVAGAPARCTTEVNATCPAGRTCKRITSTTGATMGFCQ